MKNYKRTNMELPALLPPQRYPKICIGNLFKEIKNFRKDAKGRQLIAPYLTLLQRTLHHPRL